jgi:hypothetical protein
MYSPCDWGCCSYAPEALLAAGDAKTRHFLCFLDLNTRSAAPALGWPAAQKAESRAQADRGLGLGLSAPACGLALLSLPLSSSSATQVLRPATQYPFWAGLRHVRRRKQSKQQADRGLPSPSGGGGAGDLVLSRCCIYFLLPTAYCLVHAACNRSARAGAATAGGRHGTRHRRRRCSAELAAGGGGASPLEPQKERRAPGLLSVRD